jgi:putative membrane protein
MALFWGVIAWAAVLLMRRSPSERSGTPEEILAARFAHGDIDDGEYERRLETLHSRNRS